jgi:hypothetical protein
MSTFSDGFGSKNDEAVELGTRAEWFAFFWKEDSSYQSSRHSRHAGEIPVGAKTRQLPTPLRGPLGFERP